MPTGDDIMRRIIWGYISIISVAIIMLFPAIANAGALEEYETARKLYLAAAACTAVYSDRIGSIARDALEQDGWKIQTYVAKSSKADARYLVAKKMESENTVPFYLLASVGTETLKDMKVDLRVGKVYFAGCTPEEFVANAQLKNMPDAVPKVHEGFNQFVQAGLSAQIREEVGDTEKPLLDVLLENRDRKVYLVGHSLGGACSILGGARLLDIGVKPDQVEVITFGAPAVGNKAFCQKFEPTLNVTRVVATGDPVTQALQKLVGGYEQFGHVIHWQAPKRENPESHQVTIYLDLTIKNYYQKRQQAVLAGELNMPKEAMGPCEMPRVYVAPLKNQLAEELQEDFIYINEALLDEYRSILPAYVLGTTDEGENVFQNARSLGCEWVVIPEIRVHKDRKETNVFYITLDQGVYRADNGALINAASYGSSTRNLTVLEAFIHDAKTMSHDRHDWLVPSRKEE